MAAPDDSISVLVVDDDADLRDIIDINLTHAGLNVETAANGLEAIEKTIDMRPNLVVLDLMMPGIDGIEVCRRLKADPRTRYTSVIMLTAKSLDQDKLEGFEVGAEDYVTKPFNPVELSARVKAVLKRAKELKGLNPLTQLPGNVWIQEEVKTRIAAGQQFALLYIDLDHFKAFNDYYGFVRGDRAIEMLARKVGDAIHLHAGTDGFLGHVGGDDFIAVTGAHNAEAVAKEIIDSWDESVAELYDPEDRERGFIEVLDRQKELHAFPLLSVSVGIATSSSRPIQTHWEAAEIATEVKNFAKREPVSSYAIDRRNVGPDVLDLRNY